MLSDVLELVAPARCPACGATGAARLCTVCRGAMTFLEPDGDGGVASMRSGPCGSARTTRGQMGDDPDFDALHACVALDAVALGWIHRFKYPRGGLAGLDPYAHAVLSELAREVGTRAAEARATTVVPIPMHPSRLAARGFNPAALLAREVARVVHARLDCDWLRRVRDTPSQTGLGRSSRRRNVAGAFACRGRPRGEPTCVLLVDDVMTTGATLRAAARVLRSAGARRVIGICIARTPGHGES